MSQREPIQVGGFYHVFNRGVEKRSTFEDDRDHERFLVMVDYYRLADPPISFSQRHRIQPSRLDLPREPLVTIVAYCLMPNHYHFLVQACTERGIEQFAGRLSNAYTRAYNTRWNRVGPLFQGRYKIEAITTNDELVHVCRYIHLNPVVARIVRDPAQYRWSSYPKLDAAWQQRSFVDDQIVLEQFPDVQAYQRFVNDHADYASQLSRLRHALIDAEEE